MTSLSPPSPLTSPSDSLSSFILLHSQSPNQTDIDTASQLSSDDDDEIIWGAASHQESPSALGAEEDDFIVLSRSLTSNSTHLSFTASSRIVNPSPRVTSITSGRSHVDEELVPAIEKLTLLHPEQASPTSPEGIVTRTGVRLATPPLIPSPIAKCPMPGKLKRQSKMAETSDDILTYEGASKFITSYISSQPTDPTKKLKFHQALIIEFGLMEPHDNLPDSLTAARSLLKKNVFVNVSKYLAARKDGKEAIQKIMLESQNALKKQLRKGNKITNRESVKERGLGVLLVEWSYSRGTHSHI